MRAEDDIINDQLELITTLYNRLGVDIHKLNENVSYLNLCTLVRNDIDMTINELEYLKTMISDDWSELYVE